jgi:uncharacterized protein YdgA (DUF945 family)
LRKGWIIAGAVVLVLYPLSAWLMGYAIERRVDAFTQQVNEANPYVKVSGSQFHRGWFQSDQVVTLQPLQAAFGAGSLSVTVHNVIHHGPICGMGCIGLAAIDSHLVFSKELQPYVSAVFGSAEPVQLRSRLGLFGGGSGQISSPEIKDARVADGHLISGGVEINSDYSRDFDAYSIRGSAPRLSYESKDGKHYQLSDIRADIQSKRALRTLYSGDSTITVAQMSFGSGSTPVGFNAQDFRLTTHNTMTDGFYSAAVKYSLGATSAGPVNLSAAHLDMTFRHLDPDALERLTTSLRQVNQDPTVDPKERMAKMMSAARSPALDLVAKQPEISIDQIAVATSAGSALLTGLIKFQTLSAADFDAAAGMKAFIQKVDADMNLTIDDAFLTSLPGGAASAGRLEPLVAQGLATHENGKFHTLIAFHNGQATFNGKPFGPPMGGAQ